MKHYRARCIYGYYEKMVDVEVDRRLSEMPYAQAGIRDYTMDDGPYSVLVSYETDAAWIDGNGFLTVPCWYSVSTRKHIQAFVKQVCRERGYAHVPGYYELKAVAGDEHRHILLTNGNVLDDYKGWIA